MFSIRWLLYITAVVAAWMLTFRESRHGPTIAGAVGFALYFALIGWNLYRQWNDGDVMIAEENKEERRAD